MAVALLSVVTCSWTAPSVVRDAAGCSRGNNLRVAANHKDTAPNAIVHCWRSRNDISGLRRAERRDDHDAGSLPAAADDAAEQASQPRLDNTPSRFVPRMLIWTVLGVTEVIWLAAS
jgi:hypothetical protein